MSSETADNCPITQARAFCIFIKHHLTQCYVDYFITTSYIKINLNFNHKTELSLEDITIELDQAANVFEMIHFGWSNFFSGII